MIEKRVVPVMMVGRTMIVFAIVVGTVVTARAGDSIWKVLPIFGGGYVQNVIPCLAATNVFYAFVDVGGPYRSDDSCLTWRPLHGNMTLEQRRHQFDYVRSLSVDPRDEDNLVIAAGDNGDPARKGGFAVSRDGGRSWKVTGTATFYGNGDRRWWGNCLDRNPFNPDELVGGGDMDGLFVSHDNGETWKKVGLEGHWFSDVRYDRVVANRIYASAPPWDPAGCHARWRFPEAYLKEPRKTGFYRSDNGGRTWRKVYDEAPIEVCQQEGCRELIAIFDQRLIRRSKNGGATWSEFQEGLPNWHRTTPANVWDKGRFHALAAGRKFYLAGDGHGCLYKRGSGEKSWHEIEMGPRRPGNPVTEPRLTGRDPMRTQMTALGSIIVDLENPDRWFTTDWFDIWETTDAGANWTSRVTGMMQLCSLTMGFDPFDAANIVYGVMDVRVFVSNDGGQTYVFPRGGHFAGCDSIAFSWNENDRGLALMAGGKEKSEIRRTRNGGRSWDFPTLNGMPKLDDVYRVYTVAYDRRRDAYWACVSGPVGKGKGGVYNSVDAGETWMWIGDGLPENKPFYQAHEGGKAAWPQLAVSPDGSVVTTGKFGTWDFYFFDDAQKKWNKSSNSGIDHWEKYTLAEDPFTPGRFLHGGRGALKETTDGGRSWHPLPGWPRPCEHFTFDAQVPGLLVIGCEDALRISRDGGKTFRVLEDGLAFPSGTERRVFCDRGRLFAFSSGSGCWVRQLD